MGKSVGDDRNFSPVSAAGVDQLWRPGGPCGVFSPAICGATAMVERGGLCPLAGSHPVSAGSGLQPVGFCHWPGARWRGGCFCCLCGLYLAVLFVDGTAGHVCGSTAGVAPGGCGHWPEVVGGGGSGRCRVEYGYALLYGPADTGVGFGCGPVAGALACALGASGGPAAGGSGGLALVAPGKRGAVAGQAGLALVAVGVVGTAGAGGGAARRAAAGSLE